MEWPLSKLKWPNILTLCCHLSVKFDDDDGQLFFETAIYAWLFKVYIYSKCACASLVGEKVIGPKPDHPNRLLRAYTRWGKTTCSNTNGAQLLSAGMGARFFSYSKRRRSKLPLFTRPATVLYTYTTGIQTGQAYLYATECQAGSPHPADTGPLHSVAQHNVPCAVCYT